MKPVAIPKCCDSDPPHSDHCTEQSNSQNERLLEPCKQCAEKDLLIKSIKSEYVIEKFRYEQQTRKLELKVGALQKKLKTTSNKAYYLQKVKTKLDETISALKDQHLADEETLKALEVFIFH